MKSVVLTIWTLGVLALAPGLKAGQEAANQEAPPRLAPTELAEVALDALAKSAVDGHWAGVPDSSAEELTAAALLAFLGEGHTTSRGPHQAIVKAATNWLLKSIDPKSGQVGALGPKGDRANVLALNVVADLARFERSAILKVKLKRLVAATMDRQHEDGMWGVGDERVATTAWALVGLGSAIDSGLPVSPESLSRATAGLDKLTDPKTGILTPFEGATLSERLGATAAAVVGKLMVGRRPASDALLARSLEQLRHELDPKKFAKEDDLEFWHCTTLAHAQMGDARTWWRAAVEKTRQSLAKLSKEEVAHVDTLSRLLFVISSAYRLEPRLETKK